MFTLPALNFEFDGLEPYMDQATVEIHYSKHHQGYADKLNAALKEQPELLKAKIEDLLTNLSTVPEEVKNGVRNFGGGYANHNLFWQILKLNPDGTPVGELAEKIKATFGSFEDFKLQFSDKAGGVFGSGWCHLVVNQEKELEIVTTPNQDSPLSLGKVPIMNLDVWEHAYYLKYQNRRADFISAFWSIINWEQVAQNFQSCGK